MSKPVKPSAWAPYWVDDDIPTVEGGIMSGSNGNIVAYVTEEQAVESTGGKLPVVPLYTLDAAREVLTPGLLEAAKEALALLEEWRFAPSGILWSIREAIAKAEGTEP